MEEMTSEQQKALALAQARLRLQVPSQQQATPERGLYQQIEDIGVGIGRGALDPIEGVRQAFRRGAEYIVSLGGLAPDTGIAKAVRSEREEFEKGMKEREAQYAQFRQETGRQGFDVPRLVGNIASPVNVAAAAAPSAQIPRLAQASLAGGLSGVTQPVTGDNFAQEKAMQVGTGAALGPVLDIAARPLVSFVSPTVRPEVETLRRAGVDITKMTPGQRSGGAIQRVEQGLTSVPLLGDVVSSAQRRGIEAMNVGVINRAISNIGEEVPKGMTGRGAIDFANRKIDDAYTQTLKNITLTKTPDFETQLNQIVRGYAESGVLSEEKAKQLAKFVNNQVLGKFKNDQMKGNQAKQIDSSLGRLVSQYSRSDGENAVFGEALLDVQLALRGALGQQDTTGKIKAANAAFADMVRINKAAGLIGATEGVFTGNQLLSAIRAADESKRKTAFARGRARMQDVGEAAKEVFGSKVPDSGTAFRGLTGLGALGGAGLASDVVSQGNLILPGLLTAAYTGPGQAITNRLFYARPEFAEELAKITRRLAPTTAPQFLPTE